MQKFYADKNLTLIHLPVSLENIKPVREQVKTIPAAWYIEKAASQKTTSALHISFNLIKKRAFDILVSSIITITILSWLIPILALIIKLTSRGPVFFLQKRNKKAGGVFTCIKLRTMMVNADADLVPACENDHRITRFGQFLRKHYLDELPQFINVLSGDMSIIGPRPHMQSDDKRFEQVVHNYAHRYEVKPGITGLAQALGYCGAVDNIKKIQLRARMDIFYVQHWSAKLDRSILYRTIQQAFRS